MQTRTSDNFHPPSSPATQSRIPRSATPHGFLAGLPGAVPTRDPTSAGHSCVPLAPSFALRLFAAGLFATRSRDPDIHVAGISPQTLPKQVRQVLSRPRAPHARAQCQIASTNVVSENGVVALAQFADSCIWNAVIISTQLRVPPFKRREVEKQEVSRVVENSVVMSGAAAAETGNCRR
jgi:hypothetical protein